MKVRGFIFCLAVFLLLMIPVTAHAQEFELSEIGVSVKVDDNYWYVFTRDNIENNTEMEALGLTYDYMNNVFNTYNVYMDAVLKYNDDSFIEFMVRTNNNNSKVNLSQYTNDEVLAIGNQLAALKGANCAGVYEADNKYMMLDYVESGFCIYEYITMINGINYVFHFQAPQEYNDSNFVEMEAIINSISISSVLNEEETGDASIQVVEKVEKEAAVEVDEENIVEEIVKDSTEPIVDDVVETGVESDVVETVEDVETEHTVAPRIVIGIILVIVVVAVIIGSVLICVRQKKTKEE